MTKPTDLESLKVWVDEHENDGTLNGVSIIADGRAEFRHGIVSGDLYDMALLRSAPFGYTKSEIAIVGATRLLSNAIVDGALTGAIVPGNLSDGTEFRANFPQGLYSLVQSRKAKVNWSNSQMMTMILIYFAHDPGIEKLYQQWITELSATSGLSKEEIEQLVYDRRRYQARVKRYEQSLQRGEFISDRKIAT